MSNLPKFSYYFILFLIIILLWKSIQLVLLEISPIVKEEKYNWNKITAQIEKIIIEEKPNLPEDTSEIFPIKTFKIKYSYIFRQKKYFNNEIGLNKTKKYSDEFYDSLLKKLNDNKEFYVYVNPLKPEQSSLIKYDIDYVNISDSMNLFIISIFLFYLIFLRIKYPTTYLSNKIQQLK